MTTHIAESPFEPALMSAGSWLTVRIGGSPKQLKLTMEKLYRGR
jgi:hypothetical protein